MSKAADLKVLNKEYESANGSLEKSLGDTEVINKDEGEESDDYEEGDDEEERQIGEEEEEEDEGEEGQKNTLTHLLIVNPNGVTAENEAKYEEDDEEDDEGDDDDEYVEYVEDEDEDFSVNPNPLNKKRSIDEVVDKPEEASQGSKKIKA